MMDPFEAPGDYNTNMSTISSDQSLPELHTLLFALDVPEDDAKLIIRLSIDSYGLAVHAWVLGEGFASRYDYSNTKWSSV